MKGGAKVKFKDLTGQQFGKLIIKSRAESKIDPSGKRRTRWICDCACGNKDIVVYGDYLKRSEDPSCGCETKKNRIEKNRTNNIGEKYGKLTIVDIIWDEKPARVLCKCDCGNNYVGIKADIVAGHTQSCGCLQAARASEASTKDWTDYVSESGIKLVRQAYMNNKGQWVWECLCPCCGGLFYELPARINNGHTTSCGCRRQSFGESYIQSILEEMNLEFKSQYTFGDCKYIYALRFDFGILCNGELIGLIEYDGRQHFEPIEYFGGVDEFQKIKERDKIKNTYCSTHNIPLLRLSYTLSFKEIKKQLHEYYLSLTTAGCA